MRFANWTAATVVLLAGSSAWAGGPGAGTRVEGTITTLDAQTQQLVVADTIVQVTDETLIKKNGRVITFDDLTVGMMVAACGLLDDDMLVANRITVRPCQVPALVQNSAPVLGATRGSSTQIVGEITAIDADLLQLVVDGTTIQVTPLTVIRMKAQTITFDKLAVGQTVAACGTVDDDGVLIAKFVTVKPQGL